MIYAKVAVHQVKHRCFNGTLIGDVLPHGIVHWHYPESPVNGPSNTSYCPNCGAPLPYQIAAEIQFLDGS